MNKILCPFCKSEAIIKRGKIKTKSRETTQRYGCKTCKNRFVLDNPFLRMKNTRLKMNIFILIKAIKAIIIILGIGLIAFATYWYIRSWSDMILIILLQSLDLFLFIFFLLYGNYKIYHMTIVKYLK